MSQSQVKTAVITGAAGGIGKELARRLAERKLNLVLVDLNEEAIHAVIQELGLDASNALAVRADVSKEEDVQNYVNQAVAKFGTIDYFANNAGIEGPSGLVEELNVKSLDLVYNVNVRGVFLGLQYVIPVMKKQKSGAILNTSSLAGLMGAPGMSPYIMSKHAVIGLTRVTANELAPFGIRVNAVLPGTINTQMMRNIEQNSGSADDFKAANEAATPMGRYGESQEVAAVMNFLLSEEASFVTASLYTVDGGMMGQ
ncbi:SDR family NAD(P)-dependent oxidoreductase [Paenibacillus typhae]|uniref:NAD(P)-dependent dehydrogenase, short-chain alcohol dehydrogenase family n=1 Tax=Paenibacillus typhae TaxID=1174501 RepID=A0A1G8YHH0_9BACL|nr:SDR family NAD(P)-dependent oxidoreductase [Paenibacillus typhae]SDK02151.1 NAD(P)-dependent dehydrogenase, short-chain alcohol dehydrogenase family [Paenibacillus typhae]